MKNTLILALSLMLMAPTIAQNWEKEILDSRELILDGIDLHDEGSYKEAIAKYELVLPGDTNYDISRLEITTSLLQDEQYEKAITLCEEGLVKDSFQAIYYINLGTAYDNSKQVEKSIASYELGEKYFPTNYIFPFNKGITYEGDKQYDKAIVEYQKTLRLNPFHNASHIRLAALSRDEGKLTQSALGLMTYLLINPETMRGREVLGLLNTYLSEKPSYTPKDLKFSAQGDDFDEIDELLKTQVALNKKYEFDSDVDYPAVRQCHALLTLLQDYEGDGGFYDEFYVPFYQDLMAKEVFEGFSYFLVSSSSNDNIIKTITKNEKAITSFASWMYDEGFIDFRKDEKGNNRVFFSYPYNLNGVGTLVDDKKEGDWTYYTKDGTLLSQGKFENNERTGDWEWFFMNGDKQYDFSYKANEKDGPFLAYYPNGNKKEEGTYKEGKLHGEYLSYFPNGGLEDKFYYEEGKFQGKQTVYQANGKLDLEIEFDEGIQDGEYKGYFPDGKLSYKFTNKEGKKEGKYESFHPDGSVNYTGTYTEGLLNGEFVRYFRNGTLHYKGTAKDGKTVGDYVENYSNGALLEEITYDESGKLNGLKKEYDIDGKLYLETIYVKGEQTNYKYFNKDGSVIVDQKVKNNQMFKFYFPTGELKGEGKLYKGDRDGEWNYYYKNGTLESKGVYDKGKSEGQFEWYHENGQLSTKSVYKDDMEEGYLKVYYISGELRREGRMHEDNKVGPWKYYDEFGALKSEEFFVDGQINGPDYSYDSYGNIDTRLEYDLEELYRIQYLDTSGIVYHDLNLREIDQEAKLKVSYRFKDMGYADKRYLNGELEGPYNTFYPDGSPRLTGSLIGDERHGQWTWNFIDGTPDFQMNYEFGESQGLATSWSIMGFKHTETNYVDDDRIGLKKRFYPDGKLFYTQEYMEDNLNGYMTYFDQDGEVTLSIFFQNNLPIHYVKDYYKATPDTVIVKGATAKIESKFENGKVAVSTGFDNGLEVGDFKIFSKDGNTLYHSELKNDYIDGQVIYYYPGTDKKMIVEHFKNGERHGTFIRYSKEGKELIHAEYQFGSRHGDYIIYDNTGKVKHKASYYDGELTSFQ